MRLAIQLGGEMGATETASRIPTHEIQCPEEPGEENDEDDTDDHEDDPLAA